MHKFAKELTECMVSEIKNVGASNLTSDQIEDYAKWSEIIKNITCAEKDYEIIEAMHEDENENAGYNRKRYSNGRYAPKAYAGRRMGYRPEMYMDSDEWMGDYLRSINPADGNVKQHESAYDTYKHARRKYTETKMPDDEMNMKESVPVVLDEIKMTLSDMWKDMDSSEKQKHKADLTAMINKLPG